MKDSQQLARTTDPFRISMLGMVRRMAIDLTTKVLWRLTGFKLLDGSVETMSAEPFTGIGFYARPPVASKPEAIVTMVGADANTPVIVAVRDEKTRAAVVGSIAADETAVFNSKAAVFIKADGTVEIRSSGGVAVPLALKSDVDALIATFNTHTHAVATTGTEFAHTGTAAIPTSASSSVGTTKLRGE